MELLREFDKIDAMPIGEDVRHLDEPNENIINLIMAVYLRNSLLNGDGDHQYAINCRRGHNELIRIMFNGRDWYFGATPESGIPQHPIKVDRECLDICTVDNVFHPVAVSENIGKMSIRDLLLDICSWYVAFTREHNKDIIPPYKFVDVCNRSKIMPRICYDDLIRAHSTWIKSCDEKMCDPNTSDYDVQRLTLEKNEYQYRINDMLTVKYVMLFAEQERK